MILKNLDCVSGSSVSPSTLPDTIASLWFGDIPCSKTADQGC